MKKLLCLLTLLCSCLAALPTTATNWVRLFDDSHTATVCLDADSLHYDGATGCWRLWEKRFYPGSGSTRLRDCYYNLDALTYAIHEEIVFNSYQEPYILREDELSFNPVPEGTAEDNLRLALQYITSLDTRNVYWLYNQEPIPEPSSLESPSWEFNPPNYYIDQESAYEDDWKQTYWGYDGEKMEYLYFDKQRDTYAVLAYRRVVDGRVMYGYNFPIIIWSESGGKLNQQQRESIEDQRALMHSFYATNIAGPSAQG